MLLCLPVAVHLAYDGKSQVMKYDDTQQSSCPLDMLLLTW